MISFRYSQLEQKGTEWILISKLTRDHDIQLDRQGFRGDFGISVCPQCLKPVWSILQLHFGKDAVPIDVQPSKPCVWNVYQSNAYNVRSQGGSRQNNLF